MNDQMYPPLGATARLSDDGVYRYELTRRWARGPVAAWIMLNPSTADATQDDATIRRVRGFTQRLQLGGFIVVNLFALRATNPVVLRGHADPIGRENEDAIHDAVVRSRIVVAAWGAHAAARRQASYILGLVEEVGRRVYCLGVTGSGAPRHPLRLAADTPLRPLMTYDEGESS